MNDHDSYEAEEKILRKQFEIAELEASRFKKFFRIKYYLPLIVLIWLIGGAVPLIVYLINDAFTSNGDVLFDISFANLSEVSDIFGAANSLFTGGALIMAVFALSAQIKELHLMRMEHRLTRSEHKLMRSEHARLVDATLQQATLEASALAANVTMPIFLRTRSDEVRTALGKVAAQWRETAKSELGEGWATLIERLKEDPHSEKVKLEVQRVERALTNRIIDLSDRVSKKAASEEEISTFKEWNEARGKVSMIAQQVYQLSESGVVTDNKVLRISAFDNFVATYKYYVYPIEFLYEKQRNPEAERYEPGARFIDLYSYEQLVAALY